MFMWFSLRPAIRSHLVAGAGWALFAAMGILTFVSGTRAAWIGLVFGWLVILALSKQFMGKRIGVASVLIGAVVVAWYSGVGGLVRARFAPDMLTSDPAIEERLLFFGITIARFIDSPIVGAGVASIVSDEFLIVHNVYLQVLGELGVIGETVLLWIIWLWMLYLLRARVTLNQRNDPWGGRIAVSMLGASVFFLVYFTVGHDLGSAEPWILMAMASALHNSTRTTRSSREALPVYNGIHRGAMQT